MKELLDVAIGVGSAVRTSVRVGRTREAEVHSFSRQTRQALKARRDSDSCLGILVEYPDSAR